MNHQWVFLLPLYSITHGISCWGYYNPLLDNLNLPPAHCTDCSTRLVFLKKNLHSSHFWLNTLSDVQLHMFFNPMFNTLVEKLSVYSYLCRFFSARLWAPWGQCYLPYLGISPITCHGILKVYAICLHEWIHGLKGKILLIALYFHVGSHSVCLNLKLIGWIDWF